MFGQSLPFDFATVCEILKKRLPPNEAELRAKMVVEDMLNLDCGVQLHQIELGNRPWFYYTFGTSGFGPANLKSYRSQTFKATGYGLDWGDLFTLSKVVKFSRNIWGEHWLRQMGKLRKQLIPFDEHISTIEELWWLGLWHSPSKVSYECLPFPPNTKPIDWQFESCGQTVNLEVKYRPRDWIRFVDGDLFFNPPNFPADYFDDISKKFPSRNLGQVNLVAISLFGPVTREIQDGVGEFLDANPTLDGVLLWSFAESHLSAPYCRLRPASNVVRMLLKQTEEEDRLRNPFILHPWKDREKRRAKHLGVEEDFAKIDGVFYKVGNILAPPTSFQR